MASSPRDARFDGRLFVGVTSTGVYCRRSAACARRGAKLPLLRVAGPGRIGRVPALPEVPARDRPGPGLPWSVMDASATLARQAAQWLDAHAYDDDGSARPRPLARHLGITERHVRRIFATVHGVSPLQYDAHAAPAAGQAAADRHRPARRPGRPRVRLQSLRRFNAAFAESYRLSPTRLRKGGLRPASTAATRCGDARVPRTARPRPVAALPRPPRHSRDRGRRRTGRGIRHYDPGPAFSATSRGGLDRGCVRPGPGPSSGCARPTLAPRWGACSPPCAAGSTSTPSRRSSQPPSTCRRPSRAAPARRHRSVQLAVRARARPTGHGRGGAHVGGRLAGRFGAPRDAVGRPRPLLPGAWRPCPARRVRTRRARHHPQPRAACVIALARVAGDQAPASVQGRRRSARRPAAGRARIGAWTAHYVAMRALGWTDAFRPATSPSTPSNSAAALRAARG